MSDSNEDNDDFELETQTGATGKVDVTELAGGFSESTDDNLPGLEDKPRKVGTGTFSKVVKKLKSLNQKQEESDIDEGFDEEDADYDDFDEDFDEAPKESKRKIDVRRLVVIGAIIGCLLLILLDDSILSTFDGESSAPAKKTAKTKPRIEIPRKMVLKKANPGEIVKKVSPQKTVTIAKKPEVTASKPSLDLNKKKEESSPVVVAETSELDDLFNEKDTMIDESAKTDEDSKADNDDGFESVEDDIDKVSLNDESERPMTKRVDENLGADETFEGLPEGTNTLTQDVIKKIEEQTKKKREKDLLERAVRPTDPPDFTVVGTSLVYNCTGKHWACIDRPGFEICKGNYAWNAKQGLKTECYPLESYEKLNDCAAVQQYKIDSVSKTNFCL